MSKRESSTEKLELVETQNLYTALHRLRTIGMHDYDRWKRALYHAAAMEQIGPEQMRKLREALGLP